MNTTVGYTGGDNPSPSYESVCAGDGHTEAIQIKFDPGQTSFDELLKQFWQQYRGTSGKVQYKSAIWYHNEEQRLAIEKSIQEMEGKFGRRPQIDVLPAKAWHDGEEYHQHYIAKQASFFRRFN